ncbi:neuroendocrine convertase 1-like [Anoplophora glabripennis]|uniref:neuroendocrine convertase 1-like n=1 Tax=Anoplophora glabripennis TaxID=217634 RepID=UPI000873DFAB|nr:neuroendocrine convertase 1-like [Anoplophora glabripennis]
MSKTWSFLIFLVKLNFSQAVLSTELVVRITGGPLVAQLLAQESGHYYKGPVNGFSDTYILIPLENVHESQKRGLQPNKLIDDERVLWAEEQHTKVRQKRDFTTIDPSDIPKLRVKRYETIKKVFKRPVIPPAVDKTFNDELWSQQWYLRDTRTRYDLPKLDLNVLPVYNAGITGQGVRISILDDGLEYTHDDLRNNYDPEISWDCNEDDDDPLPRYEVTKSNSHGTRCAGEVAMSANNGKCGVGIAFNSKIGAVKMLDGLVTDRIEGTALGYAQHLVDIYSASWGPSDDGKTVDGPGRLAKEALERGVTEGRDGKGSIYVWASGNGGIKNDNCNCDGYLASPYTISIGSASQRGEFPWYGEACASTLAVTYSSGAYKDQMIATTDLNNGCTIKHTGTSASAPLAAGIIALALEANPNLTWRDVQHLIVWTSELAPVADNPGWQQNAAGLWFNNRFGFGLMNAFGLVGAATNWTTVPARRTCEIQAIFKKKSAILTFGEPVKIGIPTSGCKGTQDEIRYLEHVELKTNINYTVRGALQVHLTSPSGTEVQLLAPRKLDESDQGFVNWTFMSVMTWGEVAEGTWTLTVSDAAGPSDNFGNVGSTTLILYGTKQLPHHMKEGPRNYNHNYNRIHNRVGTSHSQTGSSAYYDDNALDHDGFAKREFSDDGLEYFPRSFYLY